MSHKKRLALAYLAFIMAVSLGFSFIVYSVAVGEANRGLERQEQTLRPNLYFIRPETLDAARDAQLSNYRHRVIGRLVLVNLGMLVLGAGVSYYLVRRNFEPLEQALEAQARFTSDAAHELRTPLTAIKTEVEVGLRGKGLTLPEARDLLKSNLEEVAKLETLTNALLRLAKSGIKPDESQWQTVSVRKLAETAADRLAAQAEAAEIKIDLKNIGSQRVFGDQDQLVELMVILMDNAIKYGKSGSKVELSSSIEHNHVRINVIDHGIGIKASDAPHVFDRFYRADLSRSKITVPGYGLGLSLAKQIAEAHHGDISLVSVPDEGSTFTVSLPKPAPKPASEPAISASSQTDSV